MAGLVPTPVMDIRDEDRLAAQLIARVSGALNVELCDRFINIYREYKQMILDGTVPTPAACPELTNANPSSDHTALIEAFAVLLAFALHSKNQLPELATREFIRLFKIELRDATPATTTLLFTVAAPLGMAVTIPAGTEVRASNNDYVFTTDEELVIPDGETEGSVPATRIMAGAVLLAPNTVTEMVDQLTYVISVTNPSAIDSGSDAETIEAASARARHYQRRGERIVNAQDLKEAILEEVLLGNGIVKVFDKIKDGQWLKDDGSLAIRAGHVTVIVMTKTGHAFSDEVKTAVRLKANEWVGSIFIYIKDPTFVDFNVSVNLKLTGLVTQSATLAAVDRNLRAFYAAAESNFGRRIARSEIVAVIEGTEGVDRVVPLPDGSILAAPLADIVVAPYSLPRLGEVSLNVV